MVNKPLLLAWITSLAAVGGSLFFSERMGFVPCTLCWYQRILMYPLAVILGIGFYKEDRSVSRYVLPLSAVGMVVSAYHYLLQKVPSMEGFATCTSGVPCSGQYINWLHFVTIPFLALIAFTIITVSILVMRKRSKQV